MTRPRYKDYLLTAWCLAFDWTGAVSALYSEKHRGLGSWAGGQAQMFWHIAHNNRIYRWLDDRPEEN